jgi:pimeloyl-[acyl-carrier protein] methyl ester esterase
MLVLMPGMDGTGDLFAPLLAVLPASVAVQVVRYPPDRVLDADALVAVAAAALPRGRAFVLMAESFSGPLAIRLAATRPEGLQALVLCASFVGCPVSGWMRVLVSMARWPVFAAPLPGVILRRWMLEPEVPLALVHQTQDVIRSVAPAVLAGRLKQVLDTDVRAVFRTLDLPILAILASRDALVDVDTGHAMVALNPNAQRCVLDAPHLVVQTRPHQVWQVVSAFLADKAGTQT